MLFIFKIKNLRYLAIGLLFLCFRCPTEPTYIAIENAGSNAIVLVNRPGSQYKNLYLESGEQIHPNTSRMYDFSPTGMNNFQLGDNYIFYFKIGKRTDSLIVPAQKIVRGEYNTIVYR